MTYKLYTFDVSGNSYKIRLLIAMLEIDVQEIRLDLLKGEQHSADFLALNPKGEVPVLCIGDEVMTESASIMVYLADRYSKDSWWSTRGDEQAAIVEWLTFTSGWLQYGVAAARAILNYGGTYNGVGKRAHDNTLEEATIRGKRSLEIVEKRLDSRDWLALDRPTIADIAAFPYIALAPMGRISLKPYPCLCSWLDRIQSLPKFFPMAGLPSPGCYE